MTDFPVYIDLNTLPADFHNNVKTGGVDIRVTESDSVTEVPREVVYYNSTTDEGELWFKGTLSSSSDSKFYIYYGNSSASDYADSDTYGKYNTWKTEFAGVYHLNNNGTQYNSANANYALSNTGISQTSTSQISGTAQSSPGSGSNGLKVNSDMGIQQGDQSFGSWMYFKSFTSPSYQILMAKCWDNNTPSANTQWNFRVCVGNSTQLEMNTFGAGETKKVTHGWSINTWHHVYCTLDYSTGVCSLYLDGSLGGTMSTAFGVIANNGSNFTIANQTTRPSSLQSGNVANVNFDEAHVVAETLSPAWIKAEFDNQGDPSTFYSVGSQELKP